MEKAMIRLKCVQAWRRTPADGNLPEHEYPVNSSFEQGQFASVVQEYGGKYRRLHPDMEIHLVMYDETQTHD